MCAAEARACSAPGLAGSEETRPHRAAGLDLGARCAAQKRTHLHSTLFATESQMPPSMKGPLSRGLAGGNSPPVGSLIQAAAVLLLFRCDSPRTCDRAFVLGWRLPPPRMATSPMKRTFPRRSLPPAAQRPRASRHLHLRRTAHRPGPVPALWAGVSFREAHAGRCPGDLPGLPGGSGATRSRSAKPRTAGTPSRADRDRTHGAGWRGGTWRKIRWQ